MFDLVCNEFRQEFVRNVTQRNMLEPIKRGRILFFWDQIQKLRVSFSSHSRIFVHILNHYYQIKYNDIPTSFIEVESEPFRTWGFVQVELIDCL